MKTTGDLLPICSDAYKLTDDFRVVLHPERKGKYVKTDLDTDYYKFIDQLEERFPSGSPSLIKCESITVKGDVKFGSWIKTHRSWNVATQLISEITNYGYTNVVTAKGVVPYKETQKWSVDGEGTLVKEKVGKVSTPASDEANAKQAIVTLQKRFEKMDVTQGDGMNLLDEAMMTLAKIRTSQLIKLEADKLAAE